MQIIHEHHTFKLPMSRQPKRPLAVREPVQVYLTGPDRALLDQVAKKSGLSRAEVLRRGVRRMAAEILAEESPMLAFVQEMAAAKWPADTPSDVGERHDDYLYGVEGKRGRGSRSKKHRRK